MNAIVESLAGEAERLSTSDRVRLVEHLLVSLDRHDPSIDRAWAEESEKRLDAYMRGEISARDGEHVLAKYSFTPIRALGTSSPRWHRNDAWPATGHRKAGSEAMTPPYPILPFRGG